MANYQKVSILLDKDIVRNKKPLMGYIKISLKPFDLYEYKKDIFDKKIPILEYYIMLFIHLITSL